MDTAGAQGWELVSFQPGYVYKMLPRLCHSGPAVTPVGKAGCAEFTVRPCYKEMWEQRVYQQELLYVRTISDTIGPLKRMSLGETKMAA